MQAIPLNKDDVFYQMALSRVESIGPRSARKLLDFFGSAEEIFKMPTRDLMQVSGMSIIRAKSITSFTEFDRVEEEWKFIEKKGIDVLSIQDEKYPNRLKHCSDAPLVLFYKGQADLCSPRMISVVGTRKVSAYGREKVRELIEGLKADGMLVVSGLAYGVDIEAHRACLDLGISTVGVMGHGLDRIYPRDHYKTVEEMVQYGGVLTEFWTKTKPDRENFPMRNRIVAGMCDATVVIESGVSGGSMITANLALGYHRDVFALPGRVGESQAAGCHSLIKTNRAALFESAADIKMVMGWKDVEEKPVQKKLFVELNDEEETVLGYIRENGAVQIDDLCLDTSMPVSKAMVCLLNLELQGMVRSLPGKKYETC